MKEWVTISDCFYMGSRDPTPDPMLVHFTSWIISSAPKMLPFRSNSHSIFCVVWWVSYNWSIWTPRFFFDSHYVAQADPETPNSQSSSLPPNLSDYRCLSLFPALLSTLISCLLYLVSRVTHDTLLLRRNSKSDLAIYFYFQMLIKDRGNHDENKETQKH